MILAEIGYVALLSSFVIAILQVVLPTLGIFRQQYSWQQLAPSMAVAQMLAMLVSFFGLIGAFLTNDFSLVYVTSHSNTLMPWYYKLSATWGGHEGSLLLWVTILSVWCALVAIFSRGLPLIMRARVLVILAMIQIAMLMLVIFTSSPFERSLPNLPVDGAELNPLLQDPGLIFHPPMLYMGYVGLAVPFAFAMAALWAGRLDAVWTRWSRPWTLAAYGFLTLGIALGSWWAYYELGWGGWWFWDPVENASFMPWLAATALVHSLAVTEKRGVFKAWTIMLAILAFALSLLGTFLVRSGVITSVHSFAADPTRGLFILVILGSVIGGSLLLFALRGWQLTVESYYRLRSKETLLVVNNVLLLVATLVVLLGTLYPIIADAFDLGQVSVGAPYFNALFVPLTWLMLVFMAIAPLSRWKQDTRPLLAPAIKVGVSSVVLAVIVVYGLMADQQLRDMLNIGITAALCVWVLIWMGVDIWYKTRTATGIKKKLKRIKMSMLGMMLAHFGILVVSMGIALTSTLSVEKDVAMQVGDTVSVKGYDFKMTDIQDIHQKNYDATQATFVVKRGANTVARLQPEKRQYVVSRQPMTEAAIDGKLWRDLYVALGEPIDGSAQWAVRVYVKPAVRWLWLGALLIALGTLVSSLDRRYRLGKVAKKVSSASAV